MSTPLQTDPIQAFAQFLDDQDLRHTKLLLMISGGVDSMVLLDVAQKCLPLEQLHVLHVNHNMRTDAQPCSEFVITKCQQHNIAYTVETLAFTPKSNKESQWRTARIAAAKTVMQHQHCGRFVTAHHATDLVETMLFRMSKGCGMAGLTPFDSTTKPFICIAKSSLIQYKEQHNIDFWEDSTNADVHYDRNRIRHRVLPELRHITHNLETVFLGLSDIAANYTHFVLSQVPTAPNNTISLATMNALPVVLKSEFLRSVCNRAPSQSELRDFLRWIESTPSGNSQKDLGGTHFRLVRHMLCW